MGQKGISRGPFWSLPKGQGVIAACLVLASAGYYLRGVEKLKDSQTHYQQGMMSM